MFPCVFFLKAWSFILLLEGLVSLFFLSLSASSCSSLSAFYPLADTFFFSFFAASSSCTFDGPLQCLDSSSTLISATAAQSIFAPALPAMPTAPCPWCILLVHLCGTLLLQLCPLEPLNCGCSLTQLCSPSMQKTICIIAHSQSQGTYSQTTLTAVMASFRCRMMRWQRSMESNEPG